MKNKISKIILLIITFTLIACISTSVFAEQLDLNSITGGTTTEDEDEEVPELGGTIGGNNTTGGNTTGNSTIEPENTATGTGTQGNTTTEETTGNNTSTYEESEIPYAGPAESMLMAAAFVVCAIIGIYTFIKLSNYSNI